MKVDPNQLVVVSCGVAFIGAHFECEGMITDHRPHPRLHIFCCSGRLMMSAELLGPETGIFLPCVLSAVALHLSSSWPAAKRRPCDTAALGPLKMILCGYDWKLPSQIVRQ